MVGDAELSGVCTRYSCGAVAGIASPANYRCVILCLQLSELWLLRFFELAIRRGFDRSEYNAGEKYLPKSVGSRAAGRLEAST